VECTSEQLLSDLSGVRLHDTKTNEHLFGSLKTLYLGRKITITNIIYFSFEDLFIQHSYSHSFMATMVNNCWLVDSTHTAGETF
jgi:hypothetical protein